MRTALTALAGGGRGRLDVVVTGSDDVTVGAVAATLAETFAAARASVPAPRPAPGASGGAGGGVAVVVPHPRAAPSRQPDPPYAGAPAGTSSGPHGGLWLDGRLLDPAAPAAEVLRDGAVVSLDPADAAATVRAEPAGAVEVRVCGGPGAGGVHRIGLGAATIGSAPDCSVRPADPSVPPCAVRVEAGPGEVTVAPCPGVDATLDGAPLTGPVPWRAGGVLVVGDTALTVHPTEPPDAHLTPAGDGGFAYNRPPRITPPPRRPRLEVPYEPRRGERPRLPLLASLLPAVIGAVMAEVTGQWYYLLIVAMSPVMMLGTFLSEARSGRRRYRTELKEYQAKKRELDTRLEEARAADQAKRRAAAPDPAAVLLTATGPRRRLWERRADDPDALHLRIGLADLPADVELVPARDAPPGAPLPAPPPARAVPVTLPLGKLGVVGLSGPRKRALGLARWLVAQAAALHSPRDLEIVVLTLDPDAAEHWNWVRWLPHCAPVAGRDCAALVGVDPESAARRCAELVALVVERTTRGEPLAGAAPQPPQRRSLVVLDGARPLRRLPGMSRILGQGPAVGVYAVCVDEDERLLPEECTTVVSWDWDRPAYVTLRGGGLEAAGEVLADQVSAAWCDTLARALAPVRDVSREDGEAAIPEAVRLLDLLGMPDPTPDGIRSSWSRPGRATVAPIGVCADGPFLLDLSADGPHGLVAGTTGAGKSELLQTIIASLAVACRPDEVTFVLIDYKGGSAFSDCARLPHTVGMVSDLDGHLTERALESLSAELKRREEILARAGAKDIEGYWEARAGDGTGGGDGPEPLPRLVLVIDEFASLVAELPDFVTGLVGIAQRGRSLGVHLILATQRPAGVVSADIRANTNLRIALRVTDAAESQDVIDSPDAALISSATPGRCYVRSGASPPTAVQVARVGGRRRGGGPQARRDPEVLPLPWSVLGRPLPPRDGADDDPSAPTDLTVLVDAIRAAAGRMRIPEQHSPWLPPLPEAVTLDELPGVKRPRGGRPHENGPYAAGAVEGGPGGGGAAGADVPPLAFGLTDLPARQSREALALDLARGGHLLIAGSPRTGRTTALRTIAGALARASSPADVHVYGIDCGGGGLLPLVAMPHCGAVVGRDQTERVDRLLSRLLAEVGRRQQLLAAEGHASLAEQRAAAAPGERLPWMVLLLDRWEGYVAAFDAYDLGRLVEGLLRLLREGPAVGLRAVVTSDRSGLTGQISTVFDDRLVLRLADPADWGLVGVPAGSVPTRQPPGRALAVTGAGVLESQVALLDPDPSGTAQVAALQRLAREAGERHGSPPRRLRPLRVDALPVRITSGEVLALDPEPTPPSPLWALIGAGGDELSPQGVDLAAQGPGFVVAGPPRSGRSTALLTMARSLLDRGTPVVVVSPRRSPLRLLAARPGVLGVLGGEDGPDALASLVEDVERYVVLVDDAELLADAPLAAGLEDVLRSGLDADHCLALAGTTEALAGIYRGFTVDARRSRSGLLLAPESPADGDLLGIRLPRNAEPGPPGRALLALAGAVTAVQVALPD